MVMQEASAGSGEGRYVNGAGIIPLTPPRAPAAPGWAWCRPGWGQIGASRTLEAGALLALSREPLPVGALSPGLVPAPCCVPAHHGHGHAVEFPIFS